MRVKREDVGPFLRFFMAFSIRSFLQFPVLKLASYNLAYKRSPISTIRYTKQRRLKSLEREREFGRGSAWFFQSESMVSLQAALSPEEKARADVENPLSKKRKREEREESDDNFAKEPRSLEDKDAATPDIELNLDTPLPLEWQRCLDIKSGQIHFYNTRTHKRTSEDPRGIAEPPTSRPSLDLELNLTFEPPRSHANGEERMKQDSCGGRRNSKLDVSGGMSKSLSWISLDTAHQEMVAGVCMRCHMLVMMCKATLSCPNCKFVHPPNHSSSPLLKPGFKLLCCRD